jgi:hypothetical protein
MPKEDEVDLDKIARLVQSLNLLTCGKERFDRDEFFARNIVYKTRLADLLEALDKQIQAPERKVIAKPTSKGRFIVKVDDKGAVYKSDYFPRNFNGLSAARRCALEAREMGSSNVRIYKLLSNGDQVEVF